MVRQWEPQQGPGTSVDVTDRVGRLLGHVLIDGQPIAVTGTVSLSDNAARQVGVVSITGTVETELSGIDDADPLPVAFAPGELTELLAELRAIRLGMSLALGHDLIAEAGGR